MGNPLKTGKVTMLVGISSIIIGYLIVADSDVLVESFTNFGFILLLAGMVLIILGVVSFCRNAHPRVILSFAGRAIATLIAMFILLAILFPNSNVHDSIMLAIISLVALTALSCITLLYGLVRLRSARRDDPSA
jgi:hypothetical protein